LLVNLEQGLERFCLQWLLAARARLALLRCCITLNRLIRSLVVCAMRAVDWLIRL